MRTLSVRCESDGCLLEYDTNADEPQAMVDLVQVAEGLKLKMWVNAAGIEALASGQGLSLAAGAGLIVGDLQARPVEPTANPDLARLELNTGR